MVAPFMPDAEKVAAVREALPAVGAGIYLNTGAVGPLPAETAAAMAEFADHELRLGRAHSDQLDEFLARMDEARGSLAAVIGADVRSIALTHAATDGMNAGAFSIDWRAGDRIVTTRHEHAGGLAPLVAIRDRFRVELAFAEIDGPDAATGGAPGRGADAATGTGPEAGRADEEIVAAFDAAITDRTRLVSLSHVLWTTGARLPVERIAALAHERGAMVVVDGAQAVGAIPVAVEETGADLYAFPGQKWLLGPEGTGALWASPTTIEAAGQSAAGWFNFESLDLSGRGALHRDARRFDASGFHRPSVVGLARSAGWLSMYVGWPWIHERAAAQARRAADRLAAIPGVRLLTPRDRMATLVTFRIGGWEAQPALDEIAARSFAIARTVPDLDAIRLSVAFFTTDAEVERVAEVVELLATHAPGSLPPRRVLTILGQDGA